MTKQEWIDSARSLLAQHRRSHDALYANPCMCTVCVAMRRLLETQPMDKADAAQEKQNEKA